jgi:hypothetical protein
MNISLFMNIFKGLQDLLCDHLDLVLSMMGCFKMRFQSGSTIFHQQSNVVFCLFVIEEFDDIRVI